MKRMPVLLAAGLLVLVAAASASALPDKNPARADWWVVDCDGTQYDVTVLSVGRVGWPDTWMPGATPWIIRAGDLTFYQDGVADGPYPYLSTPRGLEGKLIGPCTGTLRDAPASDTIVITDAYFQLPSQ
ncbi:MAG: hypothetical protein AB1Z66_01875 [Candidatus Limnocylindrales bacterium]